MAIVGRPDTSEYADFYSTYVSKVDSDDIVGFLANQIDDLTSTLDGVDEEKASRIQEPYLWSLKQLLGHLIDGEKVFGYRLHRMASNDPTPLAGFEHEPYVANMDYQSISLSKLVEEWTHVRNANLLLLQRLPDGAAMRQGTASDCQFTVRSQSFIIAGHVEHHLEIIKKRLQMA